MFPLGESTLALDAEMLQVLDAVDPVKPADENACPKVINRDAQKELTTSAVIAPSRPLAPVSDNNRDSDRAMQPTGQGPRRACRAQERVCGRNADCKKAGWRPECKDLAQRLLFSEDLEEAEHAQKGPKNIQSLPASSFINGRSSQGTKNGQQVGRSSK